MAKLVRETRKPRAGGVVAAYMAQAASGGYKPAVDAEADLLALVKDRSEALARVEELERWRSEDGRDVAALHERIKEREIALGVSKETIAAQQLALRDAEKRAFQARQDAFQLAAAIEDALRMYREGAPYSAREALSVALAKHNLRLAGGEVKS